MKTGTIINLIFDANRGTVSQLSREGVCGQPVGELPTPVRRGYTFCGWYCGDVQVSANTVIETDEDIRLVARWEKAAPVADKKRSMLKRQKIAIAVLAAVSVALIITFVIVAQLISIYSFVDSYTVDGVPHEDKYYVKRHEGVYKLFDEDGNLMDTNGVLDTVFIAKGSGNQYKINPDTGAHTLRARVDTEYDEDASGTSLLVFPQLLSSNIYSIKMENKQGADYTIYRTGESISSFKIEGFEDSQLEFDQELLTQLCFSCGYLLANRKMSVNSTDPNIPRLEDGTIDYSVYGLDDPQATYTVTGLLYDTDGKPQPDAAKTYTVYVGDAIVSGGGYYIQLQGRPSVYIISTDYIESTVLQPIEKMVVPRAVFPVSVNYHSMGKDFYLGRLSVWDQPDSLETIVAFTYSELEERVNTINSIYPYIPQTSVMAGYKINTDSAFTVFESFYSLECMSCCHIGINEEALKEYGLDKDVYYLTYWSHTGTTDDRGNKEYVENELFISQKTERGTHYIASVPFNMIVEVDQYYLSFLEWDNIKWYDDAFVSHNIAYIRDLYFNFGGQEYNFMLDNTLSHAFYKSGNTLKAVDLTRGRVYTEGNKQKYELDGKVYDLIVIKWENEGEEDSRAVEFVTQKDIIQNPNLENVIYVQETFYYVQDGKNIGVSPDYVNSYIEYEVATNDKGEYIGIHYFYVDSTGTRKQVQRSLGDPIYRYKKGLEATLSISANGLKIYCDQYEGGLLDYVIDKPSIGDDGTNKREDITALQNFKNLLLQLVQFSLSGDADEVEFKNAMGMTIEEFLKQNNKTPMAEIKVRVEDYAKFFNGHTYRDENGNEVQLYDENVEQYYAYKFYQYTDWKALVTVELFTKNENGEFVTTAEDGVVGRFYVSTSVLEKLEKDVERLLNKEPIESNKKH